LTKVSSTSATEIDTAPVEQSAVPESGSDVLAITHALVLASPWRRFGTGTGGPSGHPAFVHVPFPRGFAVLADSSSVVPSQRTSKVAVLVGKGHGSGRSTFVPPK